MWLAPEGAGPETDRHGASGRRPRRLRRRVVGVLVIVVIAVLESMPGAPGYQQLYLLGRLGASDARAAAAEFTPFLPFRSSGPCSRLESEFGAGSNLLRNDEVGLYADIWSSYQALNALYVASLSASDRSCQSDFAGDVAAIDARYWDVSYEGSIGAFDQGPRAFHLHLDLPRVDDSLWMGLANAQAYRITRDQGFLRRAEAVFRLAVANWDPANGGIYWVDHAAGVSSDYEKSVVSNAPAVVLGAALFSETGNGSYLTWSGCIMHWLEFHLVDPGTGLYDDHIDDHTSRVKIDSVKLTYNQGTVVGALTSLATVDPAHYSIDSARDLAYRSMAYFEAHHTYGLSSFDAIWAANLLWSTSLYQDATFVRAARSSVELAVKDEPAASSALGTEGSRLALQALAGLPPTRYPALSYTP